MPIRPWVEDDSRIDEEDAADVQRLRSCILRMVSSCF